MTTQEQQDRFYMLVQSSLKLKFFEQAKLYANMFTQQFDNTDMASRIFFQIASVDYEREKYDEASTYFDRVLKLPHSQWHAESLFLTGEILYLQNKKPQATVKYKSYLETIKNETYQSLARFRLGELAQETGDWQEAISYDLSVLGSEDQKTDPDLQRQQVVHRRLGKSYLKTKAV